MLKNKRIPTHLTKPLMKTLKALATIAALTTASFALPAQATITIYTNLAAFQAAAGGTTLETFGGATLGTATSNYSGAFNGFTLKSVSNGDLSGIANGSIGPNATTPPAAFNGQNFYGWGEGDGGIGPVSTFTFASGTHAFGFDWFDTDLTDSYSVTVNNLTTTVFNYGSSGFFGVVATGESFSTASIQNVTDGGFVDTEGLDNVRVGTVPEPSGIALFGLAIAGLVVARRKSTAK